MIVLNVGGGPTRSLPACFDGWEQHLLDIDPAVNPDILCDALEMHTLPAAYYDAVHCSHNLEHFYAHDVPRVLAGFLHVLKPGGEAHIAVPNMQGLFDAMRDRNLDIGDVWYRTTTGMAITFHDVMYGWGPVMAEGNLFYAHKCGFTATTLSARLREAGFVDLVVWWDSYNLHARAKKCQPQ
jgi:predicted SAM-dependent methyltransferase